MELKPYQKDVITDLKTYLELLNETHSTSKAYSALWAQKNIPVDGGINGMPFYRTQIPGVPEVCFKVPTGGGKTLLAASSIKPIFDSMPMARAKAVVWLVPSDAILTQTYAALSNPDHLYRQKLDTDFGSCVEVYSKNQLLNGQNFSPASVVEQLSVFVLSYDSFRTSKKEGRKAYQENGNLAMFPKQMADKSMLLPDTDETALIQVIRSLNPVVIVDESHHATSNLSIEMLQNFNPCFVLDLTATPKKNSNLISIVGAAKLKNASMVKLPVIVYNRRTQEDVYTDAYNLRNRLEAEAMKDQETTGRYIRPIVLFQAQPKSNADSTTYQKIKETLSGMGIPDDQIAIKTADKDELKGIDLKSPCCPIRYIITVNALKEGWDCPFAYILATVANRSSAVDVEQILGRILRLPDTKQNPSDVLNLSYVITNSSNFYQALDKIVAGLNNAGFSSRDCRVGSSGEGLPIATLENPKEQMHIEEWVPFEENAAPQNNTLESPKADFFDTASPENNERKTMLDTLLQSAIQQNNAYEESLSQLDATLEDVPMEVRSKINVFRMKAEFAQEAAKLRFPQFVLNTAPSFFSHSNTVLLSKESLSEGFTLRDKDIQIDFATLDADMARVDVDDQDDAVPKAWKMSGTDSGYFKGWFNGLTPKLRRENCKGVIRDILSKFDCIDDKEIKNYINRIVENMTSDQLADLEKSPYPYALKIKGKVAKLLEVHRTNMFNLWLDQGKITCTPYYALKPTISPATTISTIPKSLYTSEESVDKYERQFLWDLSALDNIKWWHRNISRRGFQVNGPVHAYPDIIAMTMSGTILMLETKGDFLDGDGSKEKAKIGSQWDKLAGPGFRYFMIFKSKAPDFPGAYGYDRFMEIVKAL